MYHVPFTMYNFIKLKQVPMYYFHQTNVFCENIWRIRKKILLLQHQILLLELFLLTVNKFYIDYYFPPLPVKAVGELHMLLYPIFGQPCGYHSYHSYHILNTHHIIYHLPCTMYNFIKLKQVKIKNAKARRFFEHGRHKRNGIRTLRCLKLMRY